VAQGLHRSYNYCPKEEATKCSNYRTIGLIAHTAKTEAKILGRRIERKIEDVLGEDQFGFRRGKGTRDAIGMMTLIAERTLEIQGDSGRICNTLGKDSMCDSQQKSI
jgi:hypothetical protein